MWSIGSDPVAIDVAAPDRLAGLDDESARQSLVQIKGIGSWSADVYLLFALLRPDVWPNGDQALVLAMAENLGLDDVPSYV